MQNDQIYSDIIKTARTRRELEELKEHIIALEQGIYQTKANTFDTLLASMPVKLASAIRSGLQKVDKIELIRELKKKLDNVEFMQLTLAFEPTDGGVAKIYDWVRNNLEGNIVLEIVVVKSIIGGARVAVGGKYVDLSIKKMLEKELPDYA